MKLRFAGWHVLPLPAACDCCEDAGVDVPASACAAEPGFAGEVVAEPLEELPEPPGEVVAEPPDELPKPPGEQPAAPSPTAKTQSVTDMDVRNRMEFLRGHRSWVVLPGRRFNAL